MSRLLRTKNTKTIRSMREFMKKFLPKHLDKYPIEMFVSKEEHDLIINRRGIPNYGDEDSSN